MYEKKQVNFKSPNMNNLQEVIIDNRTRIYIQAGTDPEMARKRYLDRVSLKKY